MAAVHTAADESKKVKVAVVQAATVFYNLKGTLDKVGSLAV
jgi:hypothetical protein